MFTPQQWIALCIFIVVYVLIFVSRIRRTSVVLVGAIVLVATGVLNQEQLFTAINWETLGIILGMFIIVAALRKSGFFEWVGLYLARTVDHHPVMMFITLPLLTALLSSVLDCVTVVIFMTTLTLEILNVLKINPTPYILAEVSASNIGGCLTMVSDPTNVIIGTSLKFSFNHFAQNTAPIALAALGGALLFIYFKNRSYLHEECIQLHRQHKSNIRIDPKRSIKDTTLLKISIIALILAVIFLIFYEKIHISLVFATIIPATLILLVFDIHKLENILKDVDWQIFIFFFGIFIIIAGLETTGILNSIAYGIAQVSGGNLALAVTVVLWSATILSFVIDDVPLTVTMIPVVIAISSSVNFPVEPFAWALSLGIGIGGNATPVGTATSISVLAICKQQGHKISNIEFIKNAVPITVCAIAICNLLLILRYCL